MRKLYLRVYLAEPGNLRARGRDPVAPSGRHRPLGPCPRGGRHFCLERAATLDGAEAYAAGRTR